MLYPSLGLPRSAATARCLQLSKHHQLLLQRQRQRHLVTLAIETSCDDTCVAVLEYNKGGKDGKDRGDAILHFHEKVTAPNTGKGGIVPVEASTSHRENLAKLVQKALRCAQGWQTRQKRPDFISVTRGPGMYSNLVCGLDTAKGLAAAFDVPLIGVHHMQAHALTPRLMDALSKQDGREQDKQSDENSHVHDNGDAAVVKPAFPFLTLLVSGGHTMLLRSESLTKHSILANTMDIAIGDCLDKCGREILPHLIKTATTDTAFGKYLSEYAFPDPPAFSSYYSVPTKREDEIDKPMNEWGWRIQPPLGQTRKMAFSYGGFVSHVARTVADMKTRTGTRTPEEDEAERLALARAALGTAFEHLGSRVIIALESLRADGTELSTLVVSGGVAANDFLRFFLRRMLDVRGFGHVQLVFPPIKATFLPSTLDEDDSSSSNSNSSSSSSSSSNKPVVLHPCTDNAAMIAWAGMEMYNAGWHSDFSINAIPKWSLDGDSIAEVTSRHTSGTPIA